jgi:hypothetical protein
MTYIILFILQPFQPVSGPHLGANKACRGMISGDKMGLESFLNDEEGLSLGRSFGSGAWLIVSKTMFDI